MPEAATSAAHDAAPDTHHRIPSLDGFRALAILLVLGEHSLMSVGFPRQAAFLRPLFSGYLGVRIFFVVSGYLITSLILGEQQATGRISLRRFYARRALRLLPAYAAYSLVLVILVLTTPLHLPWCNYVTLVTFTKDFGCGNWVDGHFWSLAVEAQFYLFWPLLLIRAPRRWRGRSVWIAVIGAAAARLLFFHEGWYDAEFFSLFVNVDALMLGCALGLWAASDPRQFARFFAARPTLWRTVAVAVIGANLFRDWVAPGGVLGVGLIDSFAAIATAYLAGSFATVRRGHGFALLNAAPMTALGALSYSIYVWQQPFLDGYNDFHYTSAPLVLTFPFNLLAALAVGIVSYRLLERPLFEWRRRLRGPSGASAAVDKPVQAARGQRGRIERG